MGPAAALSAVAGLSRSQDYSSRSNLPYRNRQLFLESEVHSFRFLSDGWWEDNFGFGSTGPGLRWSGKRMAVSLPLEKTCGDQQRPRHGRGNQDNRSGVEHELAVDPLPVVFLAVGDYQGATGGERRNIHHGRGLAVTLFPAPAADGG